MFFNKFDVTIQFDTEKHGEKGEALKLHLPRATAEDLTLIQNFNELWQRGVQANPKENGDQINASMMLHRGWFEEDTPQEPEPVVAAPAPKAEKAPSRRRKKVADPEPPAAKAEEVKDTAAVASESQSAKEPEAAPEQDEGSSEPDHPSEPEEQEVIKEEPVEEPAAEDKPEEPAAPEAEEEPEEEAEEADTASEVISEEIPEAPEAPQEPINVDPVLEEGWEKLKETNVGKEAVWKFACDSIPTEDNPTAKGERRLLSAASSMVILDPRLKNDAEATLDRVRRILRMDLEELYDLFAPENVSDEQHDAVDAFESFKTLAHDMQLKCQQALAKRLGA